jgi:hypothetical protein
LGCRIVPGEHDRKSGRPAERGQGIYARFEPRFDLVTHEIPVEDKSHSFQS